MTLDGNPFELFQLTAIVEQSISIGLRMRPRQFKLILTLNCCNDILSEQVMESIYLPACETIWTNLFVYSKFVEKLAALPELPRISSTTALYLGQTYRSIDTARTHKTCCVEMWSRSAERDKMWCVHSTLAVECPEMVLIEWFGRRCWKQSECLPERSNELIGWTPVHGEVNWWGSGFLRKLNKVMLTLTEF